jgi:protein archease
MNRPARGHRAVPHTADIRIEAWGPTWDACLTEAVTALVDSFADTTGARPERIVTADLPAGTDADRLAAVLDEVIYLLDTEDAVPLGLEVDTRPEALHVRMPVAALDTVEMIGAVPKAVALSGLRLYGDDGHWEAAATIDV